MAEKQNPTTQDRVLWSGLVGASTESITLTAHRAQHLIAVCGVRPELASMVAALVFGTGEPRG